ncbi:MAG TPA: thiamine pyrophosphate-binding protein [Burkholderiales bacterium]|nr:thiamine pyrophosphate-binding protein [Burkholderiales bacterium]
MADRTGADVLVSHLAARGVKRFFGVPGGDCSLDLIDAAERAGIRFVLTKTEDSAAIMAGVTAELTGSLGVLMTTRGPGLANAVNGVAYASLDRAPLLVISDGYENDQAYVSHQRFDQFALMAPLVRGSLRLDHTAALVKVPALLDTAQSAPAGPVYLEVTGRGVRPPVPAAGAAPGPAVASPPALDPNAVIEARAMLAAATRPAIIAGLQTRSPRAQAGLRRLAERWCCPVYLTYMAKGAVADSDPRLAGSYIGGAGEEATLKAADAIVLYGADPIEFPPQPWKYAAPVLDLTRYRVDRHYVTPKASLVGELAAMAAALETAVEGSAWTPDELAGARAEIHRRAHAGGGAAVTPQSIVEATAAVDGSAAARVTVDAGAHMLSVLALWKAREVHDVLISRGLATMAFALPAAIGASLVDPDRPVIAFSGDGGLMMCAGELATAAELGCRLTVVVFNDSSLAMIGVKQRQRKFPAAGVDYVRSTDFAAVAKGFGCRGYRVEKGADLGPRLAEAMRGAGPALVDVVVDPAPYNAQLRALRG